MSLKEIAKEAGTSISTVSRVLNAKSAGTHDKDLYERIWEIARKQGYQANLFARELRSARDIGNGKEQSEAQYTVDIFLTRFEYLDSDPFFREMYECIRRDLFQENCLMGELLSSEDILSLGTKAEQKTQVPYREEKLVQSHMKDNTLSYAKVKENRGLIVLGKCPQNMIATIKRVYAQIVGIDRNPTEFLYDEIFCNGTAAAQKAVEYLISLNHRSIAYVGDCSYEARYIGYYQALMNHRLPLTHGNVFPTNQTREEGAQIMEKILAMKEKPTAIFCANDATALGVLDTLKRHKKNKYQPSVISIDNIAEAEKTVPMLTTIDIPKQEMSHQAIMLLMDRRKSGNRKHVRIEFPFEMIVRESCNYAHN